MISMQTLRVAEQLSNAKGVDTFIACAGSIQIRRFWTTQLDNSFDWIIPTETSSLVVMSVIPSSPAWLPTILFVSSIAAVI